MNDEQALVNTDVPIALMAKKPWLALMPATPQAPMSLEEQLKAVGSPPERLEHRTIGGQQVPYLGIDYVEGQLHDIFGPRNYMVVPDGKPEWGPEGQTSKGDPVYPVLVHILLVVRWADGEVSHFEGWGEHTWQPKNREVSRANAIRAATSYAITDAAKRIGPRFGLRLKQQLADGLQAEIDARQWRKGIQEMVLTKLFVKSDGSPDRPMTHEDLDAIAQYYCKKPYADCEGEEVQRVYDYVSNLPTASDKAEAISALRVAGVELPDNATWAAIKAAEKALQRSQRQQVAPTTMRSRRLPASETPY